MTVGGCATFILTLGEVLTLWLQAVSLGISLIVSTCPDIFRECFVLVWGEEWAKIDWGSLKQTKTYMHVTCHHSSLQLLERLEPHALKTPRLVLIVTLNYFE